MLHIDKQLATSIYTLLEQGKYASQVARDLEIPRYKVSRYITFLSRKGIISEVHQTYPKQYRILKPLGGREKEPSARLHNLSVKFPIIKDAKIPLRRATPLKNWTKEWDKVGGVMVEHTTKSLIFNLEARWGDNPYELVGQAFFQATQIAQKYCDKYDMKLGPPILCRIPHFGIKDPVMDVISKNLEVSTENGRVDRSEEVGEIDYFTPEIAKNYLDMPNNIKQMSKEMHQINVNLGGVPFTMVLTQLTKQIGDLYQIVHSQKKEVRKKPGKLPLSQAKLPFFY